MILEHLIVTAQLVLLHRISFGFLVALGDLLLLPIAVILWRNFATGEPLLSKRVLLFSPVPYLLFQLNYVETLNWAMASLQNIPVILFALLSLHFLQKTNRFSFLLACTFGLVSAASSTNGFLLAPVGCLVLVLRSAYQRTLVWVATFLVFWEIFTLNFVPPQSAQGVPFISKLLFWFSFLGGAAENMHGKPIHHASIILGVCLLALFLVTFSKQQLRTNGFVLGAVLWILLTAAAVAGVRVSLGLELALSVRYKIYCDLLLILAYSLLAEKLSRNGRPAARQPAFVLSTLGAVILCASSDVLGLRFIEDRRHNIESAMRAYLASPQTASPIFLPTAHPNEWERNFQEHGRSQLSRAIAEGLYVPPHLLATGQD